MAIFGIYMVSILNFWGVDECRFPGGLQKSIHPKRSRNVLIFMDDLGETKEADPKSRIESHRGSREG